MPASASGVRKEIMTEVDIDWRKSASVQTWLSRDSQFASQLDAVARATCLARVRREKDSPITTQQAGPQVADEMEAQYQYGTV